jgi:ABC-2 type transport system permease protein
LLTYLNPTPDMLLRIWAISKKELKQIRRDVRTLIIMFIFPIFMLVLFGYALNFDVTSIKIGVYDREKSETSRQFVQSLQKTGYFYLVSYFENQQEINKALDEKLIQCAVVIPDDLSKKFYNKEDAKIQYLIDGVDGNTATVIMNYVSAATRNLSGKYQNEILERSGIDIYTPVNLQLVFWFNPELKTSQYLMPGLIASILITLSVVLTAIAIVREKELGTMEQINVSPVSSFELLIGKILPYTLVSLMIAGLVTLAGNIIFNVSVKGSIFWFFISTLLYLFCCLNIGIFISTIAESQQVAFQMGLLISQLPSNLLSGFIFPIESMPKFLQIVTNITPAKFFIIALRNILIKGVGIDTFWDQLVYLLLFSAILLTLASIKVVKQRVQ